MQSVSQLDQDDSYVLGHGQEHLAEVLGLGFGAALELDLGQLADAVHQSGDLLAELAAQLLLVHVSIFDDVV